MTHICVGKLTIIGWDNGLLPDRRQAIIWTNDGILLIGPWGTNFSEILIEILTFSFKKMRLKVSSAKRWPFCLGLNVLILVKCIPLQINIFHIAIVLAYQPLYYPCIFLVTLQHGYGCTGFLIDILGTHTKTNDARKIACGHECLLKSFPDIFIVPN